MGIKRDTRRACYFSQTVMFWMTGAGLRLTITCGCCGVTKQVHTFFDMEGGEEETWRQS